MYQLVYTKSAEHDLAKLSKALAKRVLQKLEYFIRSENPFSYAKKLVNFAHDTYRFRVGEYRVIFRVDPEKKRFVILVVLRVLHRKGAYE